MNKNSKITILETTILEINSLMLRHETDDLSALEDGSLTIIVTQKNVLRELYKYLQKLCSRKERIQGKLNVPTHSLSKAEVMRKLREHLTPAVWEFLAQASLQAKKNGWHLYLVGGAIRDLLLADKCNNDLFIQDIDLVVDGPNQYADVGAGIELAKKLQAVYSEARLEIHGNFQTAALLCNDSTLDSLHVDIATARTEFYPYPASNPEVKASSIWQDLYRRDFTINALALELTPPSSGEILDFFGGLLDLEAKQIRVLHANSFIEDPTRIFRGVRFAVRFGFEIETQTQEYIRYATSSGIYEHTTKRNKHVPALQSRLKNELKHILENSHCRLVLQLLGSLGALKCIHPTLELDRQILLKLRLLDYCFHKLSYQVELVLWQMRLEVLIAHIKPQYRLVVIQNLQLYENEIKRLQGLDTVRAEIQVCLTNCKQPSQIVQLLRQYELPLLVLVLLHSPKILRKQIWHYLSRLMYVQPIINGNDLKKLGYKPGPLYRTMLDDLLFATLDGKITNYNQAKDFLTQLYPKC